MMDDLELDRRFDYHPPKDADTAQLHERTRATVKGLAVYFALTLPPGRELSMVVTKLEEALFWANAAIARK